MVARTVPSRLKSKMTREIFQRQMLAGDVMDSSANELYPEHVQAIIEALLRHSSIESIKRAFALMSLWRCAGRSSEPGYLHYHALSWNQLFQYPTIEAP